MEVNRILLKENIQNLECDICDKSLQLDYGVLKANWAASSHVRRPEYEVHLCKSCFFGTLAYLRSQKKMNHLFDENFDFAQLDNFGLK